MLINLENATIFTIAESPESACKALSIPTMTEAEYRANVAPVSIPLDMLIYAQYKGDLSLEKKIEKYFSATLSNFFNE